MRIRQGILALAVGLLPVGMAVSGCGAERAATHTAGVDTAQGMSSSQSMYVRSIWYSGEAAPMRARRSTSRIAAV